MGVNTNATKVLFTNGGGGGGGTTKYHKSAVYNGRGGERREMLSVQRIDKTHTMKDQRHDSILAVTYSQDDKNLKLRKYKCLTSLVLNTVNAAYSGGT